MPLSEELVFGYVLHMFLVGVPITLSLCSMYNLDEAALTMLVTCCFQFSWLPTVMSSSLIAWSSWQGWGPTDNCGGGTFLMEEQKYTTIVLVWLFAIVTLLHPHVEPSKVTCSCE